MWKLFDTTNSSPRGNAGFSLPTQLLLTPPPLPPRPTLTSQVPPKHLNKHPEMLKEGNSNGVTSNNSWARICDTCRSAPCTVYCRADMAYLCTGCDARIHAANRVASRHERVWVCEACERAPAAFLCKADAASLCSACDADIHSANPLASRHHRVPILPIYGPPSASRTASAADEDDGFLAQGGEEAEEQEVVDEEDEDEAASWLLLNPVKNNTTTTTTTNNNNNQSNGFLFGTGEVDEYLDLMDCNSCAENQLTDHYNQQQHYGVPQKNYAGDSVVPVQQQRHFQLGLDFDSSKAGYSTFNGSVTQNVSSFFLFVFLMFLLFSLPNHISSASLFVQFQLPNQQTVVPNLGFAILFPFLASPK